MSATPSIDIDINIPLVALLSDIKKAPAPKSKIEPEDIYYYRCPRTIPTADRAPVALCLVRTILQTSHRKKQFDTIFWSLVELVFPGLVHHVMIDTPGVPAHFSFHASDYPKALWKYMTQGTVRPTDLTQKDLAWLNQARTARQLPLLTPKDQTLTSQEIQKWANTFRFRPVLRTKDDSSCEDFVQISVFVAILIFAIGKPPRRKNLFKFVERGPEALLKLGNQNLQQTKLFTMYPLSLELLIGVHTYFSLRVPLRIQFTSELISWTKQPTEDFARMAVVREVKLWKNVGLNHVILIKDFLLRYSDFVLETPVLRKEAEEFTREYDEASRTGMKYGGYDRVVLGDRFTSFSSKNYQHILTLARDVTAVSDTRYKGYAPNLRQSPFFEPLAKKYNLAHNTVPSKHRDN